MFYLFTCKRLLSAAQVNTRWQGLADNYSLWKELAIQKFESFSQRFFDRVLDRDYYPVDRIKEIYFRDFLKYIEVKNLPASTCADTLKLGVISSINLKEIIWWHDNFTLFLKGVTESNQEETFTCCLQDVEEFKDGDNLLELKSDKGNSVWIRCFDAVGYSACSPRCVASMWPYISHTCKSMASILAEKLASISQIVSLKNILKK